MTDVIQQAREALDRIVNGGVHADPDNPEAYIAFPDDVAALLAVVEAADAGYLIDTRRLEHVIDHHGLEVFPTVSTRGKWTVYDVAEDEYLSFHATAAEAVAAAEREAQ